MLSRYADKPLRLLVSSTIARKNIVGLADRTLRSALFKENGRFPRKVQEDKYHMARNVILALSKAFERAENAPHVRKALIHSLVLDISLKRIQRLRRFQEEFGDLPPLFLTISPGKSCNLKCTGCYANSSPVSPERLDWDVLERIITEKAILWGSHFTVISGGEPLLYESHGKTIIDLARRHQDDYFLVYTNGTLIDKQMAKKLAEVGNITPAISVEGFENETDARRGKGIHKRVLQAFENLNETGVPFGISITATKENAHLLDEKLIKYYWDKGALYAWIFQLMPIGRASLDSVVSPEQRLTMFLRTQELIEKGYFVADFWNSGSVSSGCISAGRHGGYLYIEWNGNITPCVFVPYAAANINEVYNKGGSLNDVLLSPFFKRIRKWQDDYALARRPEEMGNLILPCPIRDHYKDMREFLDEFNPEPIDSEAATALRDNEYKEGLITYDKKLAELFDPIWGKEYCQKCECKKELDEAISKSQEC